MAEKTQKKQQKKSKNDDEVEKTQFSKELKIAYNSLDDRKKFIRQVFLPLVLLGVIICILPFLLQIISPISLEFNPLTFIMGGIVPIILAVLYPYVSWKNRESDINGKIHFFITHLRVLAISDLSLKDIINILGGNPAYGSLGEEIRKISVLTDQWRVPLAKAFVFISQRTPSKILRDFLDRFSQSLDSGVEHREFIETEQNAVLEEYKTMYESANENITILNEVYVSMLISIVFVMALGIVLPMIIGAEDMNTFIYLSSFLLLVSEAMMLYFLKSMIPADEVWHRTGEKGGLQVKLERSLYMMLVVCVVLGIGLFVASAILKIPLLSSLPFEVLAAISITPLIYPGILTLKAEQEISRKERNFLGFLPALGSIATMRGGKISESVYYLSQKDYGILTKHVQDLYRRLRTRINDDDSWEWFGIDTGSNFIQRSSEMFRQATAAAANPRNVSRMIAENVRKIRNLRFKKFTIVNTSMGLFGGITFGIAFSVYTSLLIAQHLNNMLLEGIAGDPFSSTNIDLGALLSSVPPVVFSNNMIIIFIVFTLHCFLLAITLRTLRGSHFILTFVFFVPFVWIIAVTQWMVIVFLGGYLGF
ncbi:MAG: archaellar assembly protein FlaJ [Candidatus Thermoplasmatota archaeon]|nr:archaellar assembly protein FlaJ [Candidatus Thermoplasmatota archaeon]